MGASVRIEDEAFGDERYADLAAAAGLADADHARGKMARIWRQCTIEQTHVLARQTVVGILGENGVAALVFSRLGEEIKRGVRIRGTKGRIEWLKRLRDNGKFGKKGGRPKRNPDGLSGEPRWLSENTESETPPAPAPAPAPSLSEDQTTAPAEPSCVRPHKSNRKVLERNSDHAKLIAAWHQRYLAKYGSEPTWGGRQGKSVSRLLKHHGLAEVVRRMGVLFDSPPAFLSGSSPDIGTLEQHFDKLVVPATRNGHHPGDSRFGRVEPKPASEYPDGEIEL